MQYAKSSSRSIAGKKTPKKPPERNREKELKTFVFASQAKINKVSRKTFFSHLPGHAEEKTSDSQEAIARLSGAC